MSWTTLSLRLGLLGVAIVATWYAALSVPGVDGLPAVATRTLQGALISASVLAIVFLLLRRDRLPWRDIGIRDAAANLRAFALGAGLWLAPALAGAALCVAMGWTTFSLQTTPMALLAALLPLALAVFLIEAFPEELALRGYAQGLVMRKAAPWVALLLQAALFVAFAWAVGALYSPQQWMFLPGLALILGYARALGGNVWTSIGVHAAWMTTTQLLAPQAGHVAVEGLQTLQFVAFALLPSATLGIVLGLLNPGFDWRRPA